MDDYKLIGRDKTEASQLRRAIDPWEDSKADRVRHLMEEILSRAGRDALKINSPRWEVSVFPLYYYFWEAGRKQEDTYHCIFEGYKEKFPDASSFMPELELYAHFRRVANSEIDLLIEDCDYFVFVEVKLPAVVPKRNPRRIKGVQQLVRQFVQGSILAKLVGKAFILATIEASLRKPLTEIEESLLRVIGEGGGDPLIIELPWSILEQCRLL